MNEYEKLMTAYDHGYDDGKNSVLRGISNSIKFIEDLPEHMKLQGLIDCLHLVEEIHKDGEEKDSSIKEKKEAAC